MTASIDFGSVLLILGGFVATFLLLLVGAWAEKRRPEVSEEKRIHEIETAAAPDPWETFKPAGERRRLEAELRRKEEALVDVAVIRTEHMPERIISRKEVA